jgi:hypothetical protein
MFESIKAVKAELDKARKELGEKLQGLTKEAFKELFEACPDIEAVRWRQYTPYFNDGDPCVFRLGDVFMKFVGDTDEESGDYEDGFISTWSVKYSEDLTDEVKKARVAAGAVVSELFRQFDDDAMLASFGDHVMVTATRDGFDVDEYDHD